MTTKEKVLKELTDHKGEAVSGESLATLCNVSRTAIWKAINTLRNEGTEIAGTPNGGYVLSQDADPFSQELFSECFTKNYPEFSQSHIECFKEIDSTNTHAKRLLSNCASMRNSSGELTEDGKKYHGSMFVAESQTQGRGRLGRTFVSPAKTGIYLSIVYAPKGGITQAAKLTAFSAVAVARAIKKLYGVNVSIKWINDLFLNGKKICGILTEGITNFETGIIEAAIIGIGINIEANSQIFDENLKNIAGGILENSNTNTSEDSTGKRNRTQLAAYVCGEVLRILEENPESVLKEYKSLVFMLGQEVTVHPIADGTESYTAIATDIDDEIRLVVKKSDGTECHLGSGEVSLKSTNFGN